MVTNLKNTESFEGEYTCVAQSRAGQDQATAELTIDGKAYNPRLDSGTG